ncbi:hypothetical protein LSCM1_05115 [Leishmania martiniquensis]|uniref:Uncharacterized protein n=1 Tax=Leishmania martiniquensis TaxID=1580590 RepID=A0A836KJ68_9TRYP|nr:hypothetical protein LSCM1_05115 [Leishmania martiniquensis]
MRGRYRDVRARGEDDIAARGHAEEAVWAAPGLDEVGAIIRCATPVAESSAVMLDQKLSRAIQSPPPDTTRRPSTAAGQMKAAAAKWSTFMRLLPAEGADTPVLNAGDGVLTDAPSSYADITAARSSTDAEVSTSAAIMNHEVATNRNASDFEDTEADGKNAAANVENEVGGDREPKSPDFAAAIAARETASLRALGPQNSTTEGSAFASRGRVACRGDAVPPRHGLRGATGPAAPISR